MVLATKTALQEIIARHWGIHQLRALQEPAMDAVLAGRDSLVVLPTGGGKSLCYQAPAVLRGDTTVVISPLISLMKDQVDSLQSSGVSATQLDSGQSLSARLASLGQLRNGNIRLLFVSPERLIQTDLCDLLQQLDVRTFAIDEAHCISHWGHDFRPEYRQLRILTTMFPRASIHAYTATATQQVRQDIIEQLGLRNPDLLVGNFDRPNLTYRIAARQGNLTKQVMDVVNRHKSEGGIIYCLRRADVDDLSGKLTALGVNAMPYHAGLTAAQRTATQDAFSDEKCDVVVATVAFGMGIDRSNVRYVLHTAMPKSIEHYQQETGRAGRDGLEAECVLLHSGADFFVWKSMIEKSSPDQPADSSYIENSMRQMRDMDHYCRAAQCRHRLLVEHFDQSWEGDNCLSCDICLGETAAVAEAQEVARKILSCVARVKERFGIGYIAAILRGDKSENIRQRGHDQLSTYGLLPWESAHDIREWSYQLISQGVLAIEDVETALGHRIPILRLNSSSWEVMRNERTVRLLQPVKRKAGEPSKRSKADASSWDGVDRDLFEELRQLRQRLAAKRGVPPYIIFNDNTLRELARIRPGSLPKMRMISGVGDVKLRDFGGEFLQLLINHCQREHLPMDRF